MLFADGILQHRAAAVRRNQEIKSDALVMIPLPAGQKLGAAVKARSRYISELIRLSVVLKLDPNSRILKKQPGDNDKSSGEFDEF
ncbi:terminase [Klebsiella pneumoniae]|uniref:terminase n=1 Tax=Klebsiella pneumoniae TaxID=573 RepID=UPI001D198681|nr:terminase [Klebsiella pneumoniae]